MNAEKIDPVVNSADAAEEVANDVIEIGHEIDSDGVDVSSSGEPYVGKVFDEQLRDCPVVDPAAVVVDDDTVGAISTIAGGMGYTCGSLEDICLTWMRPIADCGWGVEARGVARAKNALRLVGKILDGAPPTKALAEVGLTRKELAAFRAASPEFAKVYAAAIKVRREAIGDDVLETAYQMATVGDEVTVRNKFGNVVGTDIVKNERLLDRLLSLSGPEFQRGTTQAMLDIKGANGGGGPAVVMNFHFDRNGYPGEAKIPDVGKEAVIDV